MLRWGFFISLIIIPAIALANIKPVSHKIWTTKYDKHFRKYAKHYFGPNVEWQWFKAQAIAESSLNPNAKSSAGAVGLMQILPSTYKDITKTNPNIGHITDPQWNIAAGIYYDRFIYKFWGKRDIPTEERLDYTFASYNAGYGRIMNAHKKAEKKSGAEVRTWEQVKDYTPKATRFYVTHINKLMEKY